MRRYRCRHCPQVSEGYTYALALQEHRKHTDLKHPQLWGLDRLPVRATATESDKRDDHATTASA